MEDQLKLMLLLQEEIMEEMDKEVEEVEISEEIEEDVIKIINFFKKKIILIINL